MTAPRRCVSCGADLSRVAAGVTRDVLYCSNACRQRAYRHRLQARAAKPTGTGAAGTRAAVPHALDSFVGRRRELAAARRLLRTGRLVTLFGPAGVGKTRLGLELAGRVAGDFPGGVRLVELGPLTRPEYVVRAVASAFGVSEQPGTHLVETLVASVQDERTLLVVDGCEHLVEACGELVLTLLRSRYRRCSRPRHEPHGGDPGGAACAVLVDLAPDLVGVGVAEFFKDGDGLQIRLPGGLGISVGVVGVAEVDEGVRFEVAVAEFAVQGEGVPVAGEGLGVLAQVMAGVAEAVQRVRLSRAVVESLLEGERFLA
jgi:AAA domain